jgi:hypothetical protein
VGSTARLYDLQTGQVLHIQLNGFSEGRGALSGRLPDGEELTGEYRVSNSEGHPSPQIHYPMASGNASVSDAKEQERPDIARDQPGKSWTEVYGYGPNSDAVPVGTGVAIGNRGTVVELVFYRANLRDRDGDGVGRDNKGNWYRLQVGDLK